MHPRKVSLKNKLDNSNFNPFNTFEMQTPNIIKKYIYFGGNNNTYMYYVRFQYDSILMCMPIYLLGLVLWSLTPHSTIFVDYLIL